MKKSAFALLTALSCLTCFQTQAVAGTQELDVLWVVDDSGSTQVFHDALVKNAGELFKKISDSSAPWIDWQMGVISTDTLEKPFLGFDYPFDRSTEKAQEVFSTAITSMGSMGSGIEMAFDPIASAILKNPSFLRPNAFLVIIVVSDAPEQSKTLSPRGFVQFLTEAKKDVTKVFMYGILGAKDLGCAPTDDDWSYAGSRYEAAIQMTGGLAYPICKADWGSTFGHMGARILSQIRNRSR